METVHMTIGENLGLQLMEIAQQKLIYQLDPVGAVKIITESMEGIPEGMVLRILSGDLVVPIEDQMFNVIERRNYKGDIDFPKPDFVEWYNRKHKEIGDVGSDLYRALNKMGSEIGINGQVLDLEVSYDSIFKFINGNNDPILEEIRENEEIENITGLIRVCTEYISETLRTRNVMDWILKAYPELQMALDSDGEYNPNKDIIVDVGKHVVVEYIISTVQRLKHGWTANLIRDELKEMNSVLDNMRGGFDKNKGGDSLLDYMNGTIDVDDVKEKGIEPVNIMDGYDAGWLAPDGKTYYGMNGHIANMLHNNLADAMYEAGVIPQGTENPDQWLEMNGWVKQHGNWIHFNGYVYAKRGLGKEYPITPEQIDTLYRFGQICCKGSLKLGLLGQPVSAVMFKNIEPMMFKTKWFNI